MTFDTTNTLMAKLQGNLLKILMQQGHIELSNSFHYLQISYWASRKNYPGTAAYFRYQYQEETGHALSFFDYIDRRSEYVIMNPCDTPKGDFVDQVDVFQIYYDREAKNEININNIAIEAQKNQDWSTLSFLNPFLQEQVREVAVAEELLAKAKAYATNPGLYYEFDKELKGLIPTMASVIKPQQ